jgi:hypothetical protein
MLTPELENFAVSARNYCEYIETADRYELGERLLRGAILLANLYSAGLFLPGQPTPADPPPPSSAPTPSAWPGFEEMTLFWQVPDAYEWGAPVITSLTDALLSIYRDVKRGLQVFEVGYADGDTAILQVAAWDWQHHMEQGWGNTAVDALRALNRALWKVNNARRDF